MIDPKSFNDAPILTPEDDLFGIDPFARALAKSLINLNLPIGSTIALNGPWGSGKSSAVNLIRHHIKTEVDNGKLELHDFKCWWFRGEEALTLAFLQELNSALLESLGDKAKELIPRLGKTLLQARPIVGTVTNLLTGGIGGEAVSASMDFASRFFPEGERVETLFQKLSKTLAEQNKRFLVLIDDIDRLTPDEALLVFRLIKSVGRLPNVMYLLVFDRGLAEKAVREKYPSEGPHFLEKIIQASFELPLPARDDLNTAALSQIEKTCGQPKEQDQLVRFMNIFYDAVAPYLNTPRDLVRLSNAMSISWPPIANEVDIGDFVALEVMRLFEPKLYDTIRLKKNDVCGTRSDYGSHDDPKEEIQKFLEVIPEERREQAKLVLLRLFPRFENMGYGSEWLEQWRAQRRVCSNEHFGTFFRLTIGNETLSAAEINEFIENCGSETYVKETFFKALGVIRKNSKSKVPLLFDELNVHASKIQKEKLKPLISAIFEIADDIYREEDRERGGYPGDNHLRIHWLIRKLTLDRSSLDERTDIFLLACQNAQIGWFVDFVCSVESQHSPGEGKGPKRPEECLVNKDSIGQLKRHALECIESHAARGGLIDHPLLASILFQWKKLSENGSVRVREWVGAQMKDDASVAKLTKAFTSESWSQGLGMIGLGDRVSVPKVRASVSSLEEILDITEFRCRLEEMEKKKTLDKEHLKDVVTFLEAWRKQESGDNRRGNPNK